MTSTTTTGTTGATGTTGTIETAASAEGTAPAPVAGRLSFDGVLKGEWIKLLSLRSIRWSILIMLLLSLVCSVLFSLAIAGSGGVPNDAIPAAVVQAATFGSLFTVLIMGVLGALSVTSEYASGLILSSLAAVPSRTPVLLAKALVVAALGFSVGVLSSFGGALIAAALIGGAAPAALGEPAVLVSLLGNTLYLMLAALLALGIGTLLRSSAAAISVLVGLLFVAMIALQVLMTTGWAWVPAVNDWMPASLGSTLSHAAVDSGTQEGSVTYWGALGGLIAWAAAALIPAAILLKKRDAV